MLDKRPVVQRRMVARTPHLACAGVLALVAARLPAQDSAAPTPPCPYVRCALGIAPVWNGLAVVRGADGERVATLGFFHARPLPLFAGCDSARTYAVRAVRTRRIARVLTDVGGLTLAITAARALAAHHLDRGARVAALAGAATFGASVPLQFAADGHLARAVWWYNSAVASSSR